MASRAGTRITWALFWSAAVAGFLLRLLWLDQHPLHHDEGVNGWFLVQLMDHGVYRYDPQNYHGPLLYFAAWPALALLGMNELALRLPVALTGALMVPLLLPLRRALGAAGTIFAAWLLALSPALVYSARQCIHETYLVFFTLALVVAGWRFYRDGRDRDAWWAVAALALTFAVKETAIATLIILLIALGLVTWVNRFVFDRSGSARSPRSGRGRRWDLLIGGAAVFVAIQVLFYSSFFTHWEGVGDGLRSLQFWLATGVEGAGHEKPFHYFPWLLLRWEPLALAAGLAGAAWAWVRRDSFGLFCALWTAGEVGAYSLVSYKTPWLVLNMVLPATLTAAVLARELFDRPRPARLRRWALAVLAIAVAVTGWRAADLALVRYDDPSSELVYVQTDRQLLDLMELLAALSNPTDTGKQLLAVNVYTSSSQWPLSWYLRNVSPTGFYSELVRVPRTSVVITDARLETQLPETYRRRHRRWRFLLRSGMTLSVYVPDSWVRRLPPELLERWHRYGGEPSEVLVPAAPADFASGLDERFYVGRQPEGTPFQEAVAEEVGSLALEPSERPSPGAFSAVWEGWIVVEEAGEYGFEARCDESCWLWIEGEMVLASEGGRGLDRVEGRRVLTAGRHHLRLEFFDGGFKVRLELRWQPPGGDWSPISPRLLQRPAAISEKPFEK